MIKPINKKIKIEMTAEKIGGIQSDYVAERGVILDVAEDCIKISKAAVGRVLYFKSWAVDVITIDDEKHYFISEDSDAICGIE